MFLSNISFNQNCCLKSVNFTIFPRSYESKFQRLKISQSLCGLKFKNACACNARISWVVFCIVPVELASMVNFKSCCGKIIGVFLVIG